jgi:hypothetical protein
MLEASLAAAAGTTTHRCTTSKLHWAHCQGELSLGRPADPRRVSEARIHRLRTYGVAVSARRTDETVADLAYVPRESHRAPAVRLDGDVVVGNDRRRYRRLCFAVPPHSAVTRRAVRFHSLGIGRSTCFAPIAVCWLVYRTGSASPPPMQTFQLWQGPAAVGRRTCAGGVRLEVPDVRRLHSARRS